MPTNPSAVVLNVTGVEASSPGYATVWPCGTNPPLASNLNLRTGDTLPNLVISKIGTSGKVCMLASGGAHLLADISGYMR